MMLSDARVARMVCVALLCAAFAGCGFIADKDQIKIAKIKDRFITRGDLAKVIREMPDDERPIIKNKGDLLRVLNDYIDDQIKQPLAEEVQQKFEAEGKQLVPREMAVQRYFKEHAEDDYAAMYYAENGEAAGMSQAQLDAVKQQIDVAIDRVLEKMRGEAAVVFRAVEAFKTGTLTIADEEYQQEYDLRKDELKKFEWMRFWAVRFPSETPNSEVEAASVRKRVEAGESFDKIIEEYSARDKNLVLSSEIENNPGLAKFQQFWLNASGAKKGDIIGPVFLPEYQVMGSPDAQGKAPVVDMPAAYLVLQVLDQRPETNLTLDEAKQKLVPYILISKMMAQLRQEEGVEVYEDKLPDPAMFADRVSDQPFGARK